MVQFLPMGALQRIKDPQIGLMKKYGYQYNPNTNTYEKF